MRGLPFRLYLFVLLVLCIFKLSHAKPSGKDLSFSHWCTGKHGEFLAHPLEFTKFIQCIHGQAYVSECSDSLKWNQALKACDCKERTKCLLNGVIDENSKIDDVENKSVERDTGLLSQIYLGSMASGTAQVLAKSKVTDYTINSNSVEVLSTTLKSIPCTKKSSVINISVPKSVTNIADNVKIADSAQGNSMKYETSTELSDLKSIITENVEAKSAHWNNMEFETSTGANDLMDSRIMNALNSNDVITELTTEQSNRNFTVAELSLLNANDKTNKKEQSLLLEQLIYLDLTTNTPLKELQTQMNKTKLAKGGNSNVVFNSNVTNPQTEASLELTKSTAENRNKILTTPQSATGTTEYTTNNNKTMLTHSTNIIKPSITDNSLEFKEGRNTDITFTATAAATQSEFPLNTIQFTNDYSNLTLSHETEQKSDNNLKLTEDGNTDKTFRVAVTQSQTEPPEKMTESTTDNNSNQILANFSDKTEQSITGNNLKSTEYGNTEVTSTAAAIETQIGLFLKTTKTLTDDSNIISSDFTKQPNATDINIESTEGGNTDSILTTVNKTTETAKDNRIPILAHSFDETDHILTDIYLELTKFVNTEKVFPAAVTDINTEFPIRTTKSDNRNTISADATDKIQYNVIDIALEPSQGGNTDLIIIQKILPSKVIESLTDKNNSIAANSTEKAKHKTEYGNTEVTITTAVREIVTELPLETIELPTDNSNTIPVDSANKKQQNVSANNSKLTESGNPEVTSTIFVTETQTEIPLETTESAARNINSNLTAVISLKLPEYGNTKVTTAVTGSQTEFFQDTKESITESSITTLADPVKSTDKDEPEFLTEISRDATNDLTEIVTETPEYFSDPTETTITQENVAGSFSKDDNEKMEFRTQISPIYNGALTEDPSDFDTEPTTYTEMVTEILTNEREAAITSTNLTETTTVNNKDVKDTTLLNSMTNKNFNSTSTHGVKIQVATEQIKDHDVLDSVKDKIEILTSSLDRPISNPTVTVVPGSMLNNNSNVISTNVPSTEITDSATITKTLPKEVTTQEPKDVEPNTNLNQKRTLDVTSTVQSSLLPLTENHSINLTSSTVVTSTTTPDSATNGVSLSNKLSDFSTTIDPRLPFRAPECQGDNNNRQFKASKCSQYYQCFAGWAFLMNCYDDYLFSIQKATCIEDINEECNE